jgi:hypothetical protein
MNKKSLIMLALGMVACMNILPAQNKTEYKFGKISASDFNLTAGNMDSGANAVNISDIGSTEFEGNDQGFFTLVFTRYMRVKITNKNGFDIGNYKIHLHHNNNDRERLYSVKGSTFNQENGTITETKLDEKSVFTEKYNKNIDQVKFSVPALKEGAIYDLEYKIKSPFYGRLRPWQFQGAYPCLLSEYVVIIPPPFHYMIRQQGADKFEVKTTKTISKAYTIREDIKKGYSSRDNNGAYKSESYRLFGNATELRWVMKNISAIKKEPFITSLDNYISQVSFQLNYFQWEVNGTSDERHDYLENWHSTARTLLQDEDFGLALNHVNNWMGDELKDRLQGANSNEQKTKIIFEYVRNNFRILDKDGYSKNSVWAITSLKDVFDKKQGNVAEINLLLTAMLRHAGINADPLILSTRDNGYASAIYPLIDEYNYVICVVDLVDKQLILDASGPYLDFGQLPVECYNGYGHVMNEENPQAIFFTSDSIVENGATSVFIINDEKGQISGTYKTEYGKYESLDKRQEIKQGSVKLYEKKIQTSGGSDMTIENIGIDSLSNYHFPLSVRYDFLLKNFSSGNVFYMKPMLNSGYQANPFTSMERQYPVEMPYKINDSYFFSMEIPAGYEVDEIPKSVKVAYNENEGFFEYLIQKNESNIQMRVRLVLNKAFFPSEEYGPLRDFFAFVVKKENEQIVFKKIK